MSDQGAAWPPPSAPRQSITEVLQNPRGGGVVSLDALDFQRLDFQRLSGGLKPSGATPPPLPPPSAPVTINDFETYLRELAPLYDEAPLSPTVVDAAPHARSREDALASVPDAYFAAGFSVATADDLASLHTTDATAAFDAAQVSALRSRLSARVDALQTELQSRMDERSSEIARALANIRTLRESVLQTAADVQETRERAAGVVDAVARSVGRIDDVVAARRNAVAVLETLRLVKRVRAAADDVGVLLETGQYGAAIDAVHSARSALQSPQLRHVHALAAARARLAKYIEAIDRSLRDEFRKLTRSADASVDEAQLLEVADLISRIGRMELLEQGYLDELGAVLEKELADVGSVEGACRHVRARVGKAARVIRSLHKHRKVEAEESVSVRKDPLVKETDVKQDEVLGKSLMRLYNIAQEALSAVLDRLLSSFPIARDSKSGNFIVVLKEEQISEVSCFDEAKAAIRFAELMRALDTLSDDLSKELGVESKGGPLRAKCRERVLAFIDAFHKAHVDALTATVRMDKWEELPAREGTLRLVSSVAGAELAHAPGQTDSDEKCVAGPMPTPRNKRAARPSDPVKPKRVPLMVQGQPYYAVLSGYRFARSLCAYALVVDKIPLVASAAARRGVELSILFNSLLCKAILGAAALEWAKIRTITARHLSLASQTAAMATRLSKSVHKLLGAALSGTQTGVIVSLMEKAEREFDDSRKQLLAKILTIMMQRLSAHEGTLRSLPWAKKLEMDRFDIPSTYVMALAKESSVLHRILWNILPSGEVSEIFEQVCVAYGDNLGEAYGSLDGDKKWIRERVVGDTTYLYGKLSGLQVFEVNPAAIVPVERLFKRFSELMKEADAVRQAVPEPETDAAEEAVAAEADLVPASNPESEANGNTILPKSTPEAEAVVNGVDALEESKTELEANGKTEVNAVQESEAEKADVVPESETELVAIGKPEVGAVQESDIELVSIEKTEAATVQESETELPANGKTEAVVESKREVEGVVAEADLVEVANPEPIANGGIALPESKPEAPSGVLAEFDFMQNAKPELEANGKEEDVVAAESKAEPVAHLETEGDMLQVEPENEANGGAVVDAVRQSEEEVGTAVEDEADVVPETKPDSGAVVEEAADVLLDSNPEPGAPVTADAEVEQESEPVLLVDVGQESDLVRESKPESVLLVDVGKDSDLAQESKSLPKTGGKAAGDSLQESASETGAYVKSEGGVLQESNGTVGADLKTEAEAVQEAKPDVAPDAAVLSPESKPAENASEKLK